MKKCFFLKSWNYIGTSQWNRQLLMKSSQLENPYAIIFHIGDWEERGFWGRLFRKELQFTASEIQKMSKNFENVQRLPTASEFIRMHPIGSEWIWKPRKAHENLKKLAKTLKDFEKNSKHFAKKEIFSRRGMANFLPWSQVMQKENLTIKLLCHGNQKKNRKKIRK